MKKTLALVLAGVMAAGMTTTAFAAVSNNNDLEATLVGTNGNYLYVDANDDGRFGSADDKFTTNNGVEHLGGAIVIDAPQNDNESVSVDLSVVKGAKKVAIPLLDDKGNEITEKDAVRRLKVKADWKVGELDAKPEIEFVKVGEDYVYAVTFTLPEAAETKNTDLAGSISVYTSTSQLKDDYNDKELVTLNFGSEYGYAVQEYLANDDLDKAEIVDFDGVDDVETLVFGDILEFEVDLSGQGKLNLKWNEDFNKEFAAMYDYANIDFVSFEKEPSFNKNGTVYIYADEDAFIYEVTADGAKEINGLKWDPDYEAWTFRTRTLGAYAISDVELDEKTVTEDKDDTTTDDGKVNPDTGR